MLPSWVISFANILCSDKIIQDCATILETLFISWLDAVVSSNDAAFPTILLEIFNTISDISIIDSVQEETRFDNSIVSFFTILEDSFTWEIIFLSFKINILNSFITSPTSSWVVNFIVFVKSPSPFESSLKKLTTLFKGTLTYFFRIKDNTKSEINTVMKDIKSW